MTLIDLFELLALATATFLGLHFITNNVNHAIVEDNTPYRVGVDTLLNIHSLQFLDQSVEIILNPTLGVVDEMLAQTNKAVYPNPTRHFFNIEIAQSGSLSVLNIRGEVVLQTQLNQGVNTVNTSQLSSGIYIVKSVGNKPQSLIIKN